MSNNEYDELQKYDENGKKKKSVIKSIVIYMLWAMAAIFIIGLTWRLIVFETEKYSGIVPNETIVEEYGSDADMVFYTNKPVSEISSDAYFKPYGFVYMPDIGQIQITLRLNKSLFSRSSLPEDTTFTFKLHDTTSDTYYYPSSVVENEDSRYYYRHLTYDDVHIDGSDVMIKMYSGDSAESMDSATIHSAEQKFKEYSLSGKEKDLLT